MVPTVGLSPPAKLLLAAEAVAELAAAAAAAVLAELAAAVEVAAGAAEVAAGNKPLMGDNTKRRENQNQISFKLKWDKRMKEKERKVKAYSA